MNDYDELRVIVVAAIRSCDDMIAISEPAARADDYVRGYAAAHRVIGAHLLRSLEKIEGSKD